VTAAKEHRIEAVRGDMTAGLSERVLDFWSEHDALEEATARERLPQVICVLLDEDDKLAGVNSAFERQVKLIGNRRFWIYRSFLSPGVPGEFHRLMAEAAHGALDEAYQRGPDEPIGICLFADEASMRRDPETVWPATGMLHAGYLPDGRQVRVGYFEGARI
jgi:hypothetical protein